jgi:hypothetical protein
VFSFVDGLVVVESSGYRAIALLVMDMQIPAVTKKITRSDFVLLLFFVIFYFDDPSKVSALDVDGIWSGIGVVE